MIKQSAITPDVRDVPVFILCGGLGTRLKEETEFRPKPMVPIGSKPILWHVMRRYAHFGFRRFVLCLGFKAEVIKEYFLHYYEMNSDFTVELASSTVTVETAGHGDDWNVTLAFTGELTMTGGRIAKAAARYLGNAEHFAVTYGDGVTDADLAQEFQFHCDNGRIGTVLAVNPPSRFGELKTDGHHVLEFDEKPDFRDKWINGGYFFFRRDFVSYLNPTEDCVLERKPLASLAANGELAMFRHTGFWAAMDTQRERDQLNEIWASGHAPWAVSSDTRTNKRLTTSEGK